MFDQANQKLVALLGSLNDADNELGQLLKEKKLPKELKKELPAGVK